MLYSSIVYPHTVDIARTKPNGSGGSNGPYRFPCASASPVTGGYEVGFGAPKVVVPGSRRGRAAPKGGYVDCPGLLTCAGAIYIYVDGGGNVLNVAIFHAHTGDIPTDELPHLPRWNLNGVPSAQIFVVFASSQSRTGAVGQCVDDAADGLIDIHEISRVPLANIGVLTDAAAIAATDAGVVGCGRPRKVWLGGDLRATLRTQVLAPALRDYEAQFPVGVSKLGFMGSDHDRENGRDRSRALDLRFVNAVDDSALIDAMEGFLRGAHSFRDGSLKLMAARRMHEAFRGGVGHAPVPATARTMAEAVLRDLRSGAI